MVMRVRAVFPYGGFGFDGQSRRKHGAEFDIEDDLFSESWMEVIKEVKPKPAPKKRRRAVKKTEQVEDWAK